MGTAPPSVPGYDMLCASDSIHSPPYIQDNYSCSNKEHNPTIAVIELISSCNPTEFYLYSGKLQLIKALQYAVQFKPIGVQFIVIIIKSN